MKIKILLRYYQIFIQIKKKRDFNRSAKFCKICQRQILINITVYTSNKSIKKFIFSQYYIIISAVTRSQFISFMHVCVLLLCCSDDNPDIRTMYIVFAFLLSAICKKIGPFHLKMKHSCFIVRRKVYRSYYRLWSLLTLTLVNEYDPTVTLKCKTTIINTLFLHSNLCQGVMLNSLPGSFTLITCLTTFYSYYFSWFTFKSNNYNLICNFSRRQLTRSAIFHV